MLHLILVPSNQMSCKLPWPIRQSCVYGNGLHGNHLHHHGNNFHDLTYLRKQRRWRSFPWKPSLHGNSFHDDSIASRAIIVVSMQRIMNYRTYKSSRMESSNYAWSGYICINRFHCFSEERFLRLASSSEFLLKCSFRILGRLSKVAFLISSANSALRF